ncbi:30S ribosomal protein S16 [Bdellovibrionota bacterium FG-2]
MAVKIRLSRQGAKKNPQYLVVAVDSSKKRDGAVLEKFGHYYPKAKTAAEKVKVDFDAIKVWISKGAQPTQTVGHLLKTLAK